jgi:hypothetical protein
MPVPNALRTGWVTDPLPSGVWPGDVGDVAQPRAVSPQAWWSSSCVSRASRSLSSSVVRRLRFWFTRCSVPPAAMLAAMSLVTLV